VIYILLPAYNEEESLKHLLPKIDDFFKEYDEDYRIIVCNDGSTDNTLEILQEYSKRLPIIIINHKINRGLGETVRDLFEKAAELADDDDIIIRLDCDDTHEPKYFTDLIKKLNEGYDVVIASRFVKGGGQEGLNAYRRFISRMANIFMKFFFPIKGLREYSSGFRAYRAKIIKDAIRIYGNDFIQLKGLGFTATLEKVIKLKMLGAKFGEIPFVLRYDQKKSTSKMVSSITALGYFIMVILYYWPWGGWRRKYRNIKRLHED
jgi:dolichol-phosphate mannosyltransferase